MKLHATHVAALTLALTLTGAAQTTFTDPANLRGERVSPKIGRELPIDGGQGNAALGLQQLLRKLNTRASLMLIVAHPDDEDGGMLTFYSRSLGARVATLTLTRGEGGQNAMTGDFEDALGLIRTQELLASDRYFGADQFFGTEVDFGFSKTKAEAFSKWTHQRVLYDAVRAVRLYRPLVLAAVFIGGVTDGHGQHQVSGQIAQEVFNAAADPTVFPELTAEGILPWAPLKVYARVPTFAITDQGLFDYATNQYVPPTFTNYVTGVTTTTPPTSDVVVHEGQTDPLLTNAAANPQDLPNPHADPSAKLSYVQFARLGLGLQRTQIGAGVRLATPGAYDVSYHLYGSRLCGAPSTVLPTESHPHPVISTEAKRSGETCVLPSSATQSAKAPDSGSASFFDRIDTSLEGIATLAPDAKRAVPIVLKANLGGIAQKVLTAEEEVAAGQTDYAVHDLSVALALVNGLIDNLSSVKPELIPIEQRENVLHELRIKRVQLNDALVLALSLSLDASAVASDLPVRSTATVHTVLTTRSGERIPFFTEELQTANGTVQRGPLSDGDPAVPHAKPWSEELSATPDLARTETRPYFFRDNIEQPIYQLRDASLRNAPETPPAIVAWANLTFNGTDLRLGHIVEAKAQPVQFVPHVSIYIGHEYQPTHAEVLPASTTITRLSIYKFPTDAQTKSEKLEVPASWKASLAIGDTAAPGETQFRIVPPAADYSPVIVKGTLTTQDGITYTEGFRPVGYPGIPYTNFYTPSTTRIVPVDLNLPTHRRLAYLPGTGDQVPEALASINLPVTTLAVSDLTPEHLAHFDTVILGVRTYNAHPDLHGAPTQALLDFARNGGNVIVQYQTAEFTAADAPYPLTLGSAEKVVDETTPVRLLEPTNPALTTPNYLTAADFNGWIEERGHGFLQSWDPHYTALTETHDPGVPAEHVPPQLPQEGGLITTPLGRGHWTYVAFALYRQLPEAVPGAFRLFTNLLALADANP